MYWQDDRDVPKRIWNSYMKKFGDKYRLLKDDNNIWHLRCKYGTVQLYSLLNHKLCFIGEFRSKCHKTWFKKSLSKNGTITQEGDLGIVYVFDEKFLDSMASKCHIYRKKNLSDGYRRLLSKRMSNINKNKKKKGNREQEEKVRESEKEEEITDEKEKLIEELENRFK